MFKPDSRRIQPMSSTAALRQYRLTHLRVVALALFFALTASVSAADTVVFGPQTFGWNPYLPGSTTFNLTNSKGLHVLRVVRQGSTGGMIPSNSVITVNGQQIAIPNNFI